MISRLLAALSFITTLGFAGWSVWNQEQIIDDGQTVFFDLRPRDPRSLMQGDFMVLRYRDPDQPLDASGEPLDLAPPAKLVESYLFEDGKADRYTAARYAQYSATEDGRYTLVALADENFVALDRFRAPPVR